MKGIIMLLQDEVEVDCGGKNQQHLIERGYILPYEKDNRGRVRVKKGTKIKVKLEDVPKGSSIKIKYKCDCCGKIFESSYYSIFTRKNSEYLKSGKTYCTKCAAHLMSGENSPQYIHGSNRYCEYRYGAKHRNLDFKLTIEDFNELTSQPCHYCGGYSSDRYENSRGNGIDRKDSNIGYIKDNCVPCCSTCNFVKNKMGYSDFLRYIRQLYERTKDYEV